jgi:hypothetical protein
MAGIPTSPFQDYFDTPQTEKSVGY